MALQGHTVSNSLVAQSSSVTLQSVSKAVQWPPRRPRRVNEMKKDQWLASWLTLKNMPLVNPEGLNKFEPESYSGTASTMFMRVLLSVHLTPICLALSAVYEAGTIKHTL